MTSRLNKGLKFEIYFLSSEITFIVFLSLEIKYSYSFLIKKVSFYILWAVFSRATITLCDRCAWSLLKWDFRPDATPLISLSDKQ